MIQPFKLSLYLFIITGTILLAAAYYLNWPWGYFILLCIIYSIILFVGSYFIQLNFYFPSINKLPKSIIDFENEGISRSLLSNAIMLSFDDGPHANTGKILDILKEMEVVATFFIIGKNLENNEEILKRIHKEGHVIGNHTYFHKPTFDLQSTSSMEEEIIKTNHKIFEIVGVSPHLFRPPFGVTNPNLGAAIANVGMTSIGWNVRSYDTIAKDEGKLLAKLLHKSNSGSIILLHDSAEITLKILPKLIKELRQRGYNFTTI